MSKFLKVVLVIVVLIVLAGGGFMFYMTRGLDSGAKLEINNIDLLLLDDGVYRGKYNSGRWSNEIEVEIKDHEIREINLIKDVKFSQPKVMDKLFKRVIENQNVNVDVITEATVTSKAYLKSIEAALKDN